MFVFCFQRELTAIVLVEW